MAMMLKGIWQVFKRMLPTALALALVLTLAPMFAQALSVDVTTAKSNETSTDNVLGATPTRVTWEAVVDAGEQVTAITVQLPDGSEFTDESTVKLTVLDGTERLSDMGTATIDIDACQVLVAFDEPLDEGLRVRLEMYKTSLPNVDGEVALTASYTTGDGALIDVGESPSITLSKASLTERISNWLDEQPIAQAWNSVTFLRLFFQPQLIVSSIPTVATGWLISLLLVLIGFPLAVPIGLLASFMKISKSRILQVLAAIYTGVVRGTPLFLQIYIAFFGLPLLGVNISGDVRQYALAILVLAFNSGAYLCEIFRAGIQSIPVGQFEAARSLGMSGTQTMFSVIIPQTVRRVIPTMTSEFILLYKDTSLLAAVGVMELMLYSRSIVAVTGNMTPYIVAAVFYLIVTLPLIHVVGVLEKKLALDESGDGRQQPDKDAVQTKSRRDAFTQMKEEVSEARTADVHPDAGDGRGGEHHE